MKVKIIKCDQPLYWYKDYIGEVVDVKLDTNNEYYQYIGEKPEEFIGMNLDNDIFIISIDDTIPFNREEKIQKILCRLKS